MDEFGLKHPIKEGVTLIELMVSLTLITLAIALSSNFIQSGFKTTYEQELTEEWLTYMTGCSNTLKALPTGSSIFSPGTYTNPCPDVLKPFNIKAVELVTSPTNFSDLNALSITLTSQQNRTFQWHQFRYEK